MYTICALYNKQKKKFKVLSVRTLSATKNMFLRLNLRLLQQWLEYCCFFSEQRNQPYAFFNRKKITFYS